MNLGVKAVTDEVFKNREQHSLSFSQSRLWILLVYDNSAVIFFARKSYKKKKIPPKTDLNLYQWLDTPSCFFSVRFG